MNYLGKWIGGIIPEGNKKKGQVDGLPIQGSVMEGFSRL
jgi:hypothetical protein